MCFTLVVILVLYGFQTLIADAKARKAQSESYSPQFSSSEYSVNLNETSTVDLSLSPKTRRVILNVTDAECTNCSIDKNTLLKSLEIITPEIESKGKSRVIVSGDDGSVKFNVKESGKLKQAGVLINNKKGKVLSISLIVSTPGTYVLQAKIDGRKIVTTNIVASEISNKDLKRVGGQSGMCGPGEVGKDCSMCKPGFYGPSCVPCVCSVHGKCNDGKTGNGLCSCQPGWSGPVCDAPICTTPCVHGTCTAPNFCTCESGWSGALCDVPVCNPVCVNGNCSAPNVCTCNQGWSGPACDTQDACNGVVCMALDQCHEAGTCDPATGTCSNPNAADGSICDDGSKCTDPDTCTNGVCSGTSSVTCTAQDQCHTAGTCDPTTGSCSNPNAANGTSCNDNDACTQSDSCQSGSCTGSNPVTCSAQDQCHTAGTCDPTTGSCSNPNAANGTSCGTNASCSSGVCTCNTGWTGATCSTPICSPTCGGHGTCTAPNVCTCDSGWGGSRCTTKL